MNKYDMVGGTMPVNGNGIPLKNGYSFAGYEGEKALWKEWSVPAERVIETKYFGRDDGLCHRDCPISEPHSIGMRGEAIYLVKTVYTDIEIDGYRDPAYDYGIHLKGAVTNNPEYYKDRDTSIETWMVRGQNGKIYVYCEVTDPDHVHNDELYNYKDYHCDCLDVYIDYFKMGALNALGQFHANEDTKYQRRVPSEYKVRLTEKGFAVEFAFNKQGKPYFDDDELALAFYFNDGNDYVDNDHYMRGIVMLPTRRCPEGSAYAMPNANICDTLLLSGEPASGGFEFEKQPIPQKTDDIIADVFAGSRSVSIVAGKYATGHTVVGARKLVEFFLNCGVKAAFVHEGEVLNAEKTDLTILLDRTSYPESEALNSTIDYNGYVFAVSGDKLLVASYMEDAFKAAFGMLVSAMQYVREGGKMSDIGTRYEGKLENMICAPAMDGMTMFTDAGDGSYLLLKLNATEADYKVYYDKLLSLGYKIHTENRIVSVRFATFYNDKQVINLSYGEKEKDRSLRAVVDTREINALPALKKEEYTPVCKSTLTQLSPGRIIWMSYIIKLDNGEYFIIDAGQNHAYNYIYDRLLEMNGGEDVTVACWLFTHFHNDHIGGFINLAENDEMMKKIHVKSVIYNFPAQQVLDTAPGAGDHINVAKFPGLVAKTGATAYQARTGQKYYFGNVELEMLFTFEDLQPFNIFHDRSNPTSHIFSMKIAGQRYIMTGDACGEATELVAYRYGREGLAADYVQLPHHGWGDGGTSLDFYKAIGAKWVLYPGIGYWPSTSERWMCEHCEKYFLGGHSDITLDLPYSGE